MLGGVATQLLNRYEQFADQFDVRILFEHDHGVAGRFPTGKAVAIGNSAGRVAYMQDCAADITVIIDAPNLITDWHRAGRIGQAVLEVHTTTANFSYLEELSLESGIQGIITVSEYMAQLVATTPIGRVVPIRVVSNCLTDEWFGAWGAPTHPESIPLVWVGKLDGHKRVLTALEVIERIEMVMAESSAITPVLIGGYSAGSDRVRHVLRSMHNRSALREVEWMPRVDYSLMSTILQNAGRAGGVSLSTSRNESFGMSVAESIASGCRVAAPSVGALPEIVPPEMLYAENDFGAAVKLASEMLRDPELHRPAVLEASDALRQTMSPVSTLSQFNTALAAFGLEL